MEKSSNLKALLDQIRLSEVDKFQCDENAITKEQNAQEENNSSLAIKVLSIFGGIIATMAFIGFLLIAGLYDSEAGLLIFGIGFIASAIIINRVADKLIIDTFSISMYATGLILLSIGLKAMGIDENLIVIFISIIALTALIITQNFMLSFISILAINGCFLFLIIANDYYDLVHLYITINTLCLTYLFLNEAKVISSNKRLSKLYNPMRIGFIFSLLFGLIAIGKRNLIPLTENYIWLSSIVMVIAILYLISTIIKINKVNAVQTKTIIYTLSVIILASTIMSPSISGAIVIILLSFLVNYKTDFAIGIIALIYFISQYYYDLSFTLLTKSIILFVSGIMFLLLYLLTTKKLSTNEKI